MKKEFTISVLARIFSCLVLFIALYDNPYSYYQILRVIVSVTAFYTGWLFYPKGLRNWTWFFFIVGVLFNPVLPVYLSRSIWQIIDIVVILGFLISVRKLNADMLVHKQ